MITDLQQIRDLAERRAAEDSLIRQLPELERQQRQIDQEEQAAEKAGQLEIELDVTLNAYQESLNNADSEFGKWLADGLAILTRRQNLARQAGNVTQKAEALAEARLMGGLSRSILGRRDAIKAEGQELLRKRFGQYRLEPFTALDLNLLELLESYNPPKVQPARINIETASGTRTEIVY